MRRPVTRYALTALVGTWLGFVVSQIGFSDYDELHRMFVFADLRMFFAFGGALALAVAGFFALGAVNRKPVISRRVHRGSIPGGILFGLGWALAGACPAVPLIQLGEGKLPALASVAGIVIGMLVFRWFNRRFFKYDPGSCLN